MLSIVENVMVKKGYSFLRLDGTTPTASRQSLVDQFNHSPSTFLFLISTRAGGLGLNLTAANKYAPAMSCQHLNLTELLFGPLTDCL